MTELGIVDDVGRWQPNASERLAHAALDLFAARGYDATTVQDIAEQAGLTKTTFFRHFSDKREVLFGNSHVGDLIADALATGPAGASAFALVTRSFGPLATHVFTGERREFLARRQAVIDAHSELREREALKGHVLTDVMTKALVLRGSSDVDARVAAHLGSLASTIAFERWIEGNTQSFEDAAMAAFHEVTGTLTKRALRS